MARAGAKPGAAKAKKPAGPAPRVVWVTRTEPAAASTARSLRALGLEVVVEPLLTVRRMENTRIDLDDICAIAFTSANAVSAFAERTKERAIRVFTVGDTTAAAARTARFATVLSAQGDVQALAAALISRKRELKGVILAPGAAEPAGDLAGTLEAAGLKVRSAPLYETVEAEPSAALLERLAGIDHVLIHSAKAAKALAKLLKLHPAPQLTAVSISRAAARPLARAGLAAVKSAATPNETALIAALTQSPPH
jgi:uroporphyrinogen-III synthase